MLQKGRLENLADEIWKGAIKLRAKFKAKDYPTVILPMIMIRRIECVLEVKREEFANEIKSNSPDIDEETLKERVKLKEKNFLPFFNETYWTLESILDESSSQVESNFRNYLNGFSKDIDDVIDKFNYRHTVQQMVKANRLKSIIQLAAEEDFSPSRLSNLEMGYVYEELLRRFSEDDAKDTGEHFTPREIIRIMVDLLEIDFDPAETQEAISIYDPACGTGGMLSVAKEHLVDRADTEEEARQVEELVLLNGQEMLAQNYAVCKADMIIKGETGSNITHGNSLIPDIDSVQDDGDKHAGQQFDYMLSNPPFGVDWGDYSSDVNKLSKSRYRWGTPPSDNGAFLFLQTMIEKMKPVEEGGSKITILFNASPLSNGDATQSESEVRRHILENDLLDTIVMLPDQMFYDTGIYTYVWLLNNKKPEYKKDKVCLIDARDQFEKESSSFGEKRHRITDEQRKWIYNQFRNFEESKKLKLFSTKDFAYHKVKVVFWQEDENEEQMWVTEDLDVKLSTQNIKKRFELYGDLRVHVDLETPENDFHHFDIHYEGSKGFGPVFRDLIQETFEHLEDVKVSVVKDWLDKCTIKASFTHRHYIVDNEYIPFDLTAGDKSAYINDFLHSEINYKIISWEEYDQLGYEILPNLYFYEYEEPDPSEEIIKDFWALEEEAEKILSQIKNL